MIRLIFLLVMLTGCSSVPYVKMEIGYKIHETEMYFKGEKGWDTAYRIPCGLEIGLEEPVFSGVLSYGVKHLSQCFVGKPFDNRDEYSVTYPFASYKYIFSK